MTAHMPNTVAILGNVTTICSPNTSQNKAVRHKIIKIYGNIASIDKAALSS